MKKWLIIVLFVSMIGIRPVFGGSNPVENAERLPYGKNYLDLRNIIRTQPNDIDMIELIKVKKDVKYTLVMDLSFIGEDTFSQYEHPYFDVCNSEECDMFDISIDYVNSRWYFEYDSIDEYFRFHNLPALGRDGYNIMLYEGSYQDFTKFEYYMSYPKTVYEGYYLVDYDNPVTEIKIKESISAYDNKDKSFNMTPKLTLDTYTTREDKIGVFLIEYEVSDTMSNTSVFKMYVKVVDIQKPTIYGKLNYTFEGKNIHLSIEDIIKGLTVTDNVDIASDIDIRIIKDDFTPNKEKLGQFEIGIEAIDRTGNIAHQTILTTIKDTVAPSIKGPDVLYTYLSDLPKTIEELKSLYTSYDKFDGDITSGIVIDLNGYNPSVIKMHDILVKSTDSSGNRTVRTVHLHVIDDVAPQFSSIEPVISEAVLASMTQDDIIEWFSNTLEKQGLEVSNIKILLNEYEHGNKLKKAYIYFEYDLEGQTYQSRASVDLQTEKAFNYAILIAPIVLIPIAYIIVRKIKKS